MRRGIPAEHSPYGLVRKQYHRTLLGRFLHDTVYGAFQTIVATTSALVGTTAILSVLGFGYWWFAARFFLPEAVGLAASSISAMTLLGTIGMVGLGTLLIAEIPRRPQQAAALIATAVLAAALASGTLGIAYAYASPSIAQNLRPLASSPVHMSLFALGVSLTAATLVLDQAVLGLQRSSLGFWRNTIFAATKLLVLLPVGLLVVRGSGLAIYATWVIGNLASLVWLTLQARAQGVRLNDCRPSLHLLRGLGGTALGHHALNLALQLPSLVLPVIVTAVLSQEMNAYFYTAWMIAGFIFVGPVALSFALFAAGTRGAEALARKTRFTVGLAVAGGVVANGILFIAAPYVLHLFGPGYAEQATWPLRIIGLGVFPWIVKDHYVAIGRIREEIGRTAGIVAVGSLFELILAASGALQKGLSGLAIGWVLAVSIQALFMVATIYRAAQLPHPTSTQTIARPTLLITSSLLWPRDRHNAP